MKIPRITMPIRIQKRKKNPDQENDDKGQFVLSTSLLTSSVVIVCTSLFTVKGTIDYSSGQSAVFYIIVLNLFVGIYKRLNPKRIVQHLQVKKYQKDLRYYDFHELICLISFIFGLLLLFYVDFYEVKKSGLKVGAVAMIPLLRLIWQVIRGRSVRG